MGQRMASRLALTETDGGPAISSPCYSPPVLRLAALLRRCDTVTALHIHKQGVGGQYINMIYNIIIGKRIRLRLIKSAEECGENPTGRQAVFSLDDFSQSGRKPEPELDCSMTWRIIQQAISFFLRVLVGEVDGLGY